MVRPTYQKRILSLATVCDENYLSQAICMIESVEKRSALCINWYLLALTNKSRDYLNQNKEDHWFIFSLEDMKKDFLDLRLNRPWREFCWTSGAVFLDYVSEISTTEFVGYIDADCFFFNDISEFFTELVDKSVLIIPHNFSPDREQWRFKSGEYNVGLILGKLDQNFKTCIKDWREQVIEECVVDPVLGKCGDQTYLNDWPLKYDFVKVLSRKGMALGPWNLNNFHFIDEKSWTVDGMTIYFYHFHGLVIHRLLGRIFLFITSPGYSHTIKNKSTIYNYYISALIHTSQRNNTIIRSIPLLQFLKICIRHGEFPVPVLKCS